MTTELNGVQVPLQFAQTVQDILKKHNAGPQTFYEMVEVRGWYRLSPRLRVYRITELG